MDWILPKLAAGLAASVIIFCVYGQLYWLHRRPFLGAWAVAWGAYLARNLLAFWLPPRFEGDNPAFWLYGALALAGAYSLLVGCRLLAERPAPRWPLAMLGLGLAWALAAYRLDQNYAVAMAPVLAATALVYAMAGWSLIAERRLDGLSRLVAGGALLTWGLGHTLVVTLLHHWLPQMLVWGLLSGAVCEVVTALALLVLFYQKSHAELIGSRQELARNQSRLLAALANLPSAVYAFGDDGRPVLWNNAARELTGYAMDELGDARQALALLLPDKAQRRLVAESAGRAVSAQIVIGAKNGARRHVAWSDVSGLAPIEGWRAWGVASDVTASRQAQENLRRQSEFIWAILENAPALIMTFDTTGRVVSFNRACQRVTGFSSEQVVGRPVWEMLIPPEDRETVRLFFAEFDPAAIRPNRERQWLTADGGRADVAWSTTPIVGAGGEVEYMVASGVDVTSQRRAEQALRQSELFHRTLLENMPDGMILTDLITGEVLHANQAAAAILGYEHHELAGMFGFMFHPPELRQQVLPIIDGMRGGVCDQAQALPFRRKDGQMIYCDAATAHIELDGVSCLIMFFRDSTTRTLAQERVQQVAAGVAHNFNNLLMAITSNAQALGDALRGRLGSGHQRALLHNVARAAADGQDMVRRLEAFLVSGLFESAREEVLQLADVAHTALDLARGAPAARKGVSFEIDVDPSIYVRGARGELAEVILNLLKNALDAVDGRGRVWLRGRVNGAMAELAVSDDGPGVDPRIAERLFQPFFSTKGVRGKGLGLASSQGIIKAHGGGLRLDSAPGQPTTFVVSLPLAPAPPGAATQPEEPIEEAPAPGRDILLVEDEALVAMGAEAVLGAAGHRVRHAAGVAQARQALEERPPELLICDLGLPDGDAWDVARLLARHDAAAGRPPTPVLIITGWSLEHAAMTPPDDVPPPRRIIRKPVDKAMLLRAVSQAGQNDSQL
ncbi:PAS domain S-box protein [Desulfarculus baarsii]